MKYVTKPVYTYDDGDTLRKLTGTEYHEYRKKITQRNIGLLILFLLFDVVMHFIAVAFFHSPMFNQLSTLGN